MVVALPAVAGSGSAASAGESVHIEAGPTSGGVSRGGSVSLVGCMSSVQTGGSVTISGDASNSSVGGSLILS